MLSSDASIERWPRRRIVQWTLIGLGAVLLIALIIHQSVTFLAQPQQRRGRFQQNGDQPVDVATIGRGDIRLSVRALGTVTPLQNVTVTTQISGLLMRVGFKEGQMVRKGDFLAEIDPRPYEIALAQDKAQLKRDQAALEQARMDLTRYQTLAQQQSIARQTAEDQVWVVKQDEGTVEYDQAQIRTQELNLIYCHITSPGDGRVGLRLVDPGNYVSAGSTTGLVTLTLLKPMSVIFNVPEDSLPAIMARVHAGATLPVAALDRADATQLASGTFSAIDTQVDTTTGTVRLRAEFPNDDLRLFPSQFVNAVLLLDTLHDVVRVPVSAVQRGAPGTYVYLVDDNKTVNIHPVKLGAQDGDWIAVESGLDAGTRVVTGGADRLRDGVKVSIPGTSPDKTPPADNGEHRSHPHRSGNGPGNGNGATGNGTDGTPNRPHRRNRDASGDPSGAQPPDDTQHPSQRSHDRPPASDSAPSN